MAAVNDLLHGLLGGLTPPQFDAQIRERRAAHFKSALPPALLDSVFSVPRFERLLREQEGLAAHLDVFDGTDLRQYVDRRQPGQTHLDLVSEYLRHGATIRLRSAESFDAELRLLMEALAQRLAGRCSGNIYLTPPGKLGFPPHFDLTDVFVIQCAGKKRWRLYERYTEMTELPLADARFDPARFKPACAPHDLELARGDVLYLPRGYMHEAFCEERESMHLTISVAALTFAELLRKAVGMAAGADIALRRRVPWPAAGGDAGLVEAAEQAKNLLSSLAADTDFAELLRSERPDLTPGARRP
jgi:ribosomal protein L16 Arg81 hydroxylase